MGLASAKTTTSASAGYGASGVNLARLQTAGKADIALAGEAPVQEDAVMAEPGLPQEISAHGENGLDQPLAPGNATAPTKPLYKPTDRAPQLTPTGPQSHQAGAPTHPTHPTPQAFAAGPAGSRPPPPIHLASEGPVPPSADASGNSFAVNTADKSPGKTFRIVERTAPAGTISLDAARAIADGYRNGFAKDEE